MSHCRTRSDLQFQRRCRNFVGLRTHFDPGPWPIPSYSGQHAPYKLNAPPEVAGSPVEEETSSHEQLMVECSSCTVQQPWDRLAEGERKEWGSSMR